MNKFYFTGGFTMGETGLSAADVLALTKNNGDGFLEGNGIIILVLFLLMSGFGGNWGANRGNCATQHDVTAGFNFNQLDNGIRGIERGICDLGYANQQQTYELNSAITALGYQSQNCCCETNRNIDAIRFENAKNTCDITTAIHNEGEQTRALITANVMQELRDQNQAYQLQLSNQAQSANLIATLRPTPIPAYVTCSPYQATNVGFGYGCGACAGV
jgi:hypothetical protein